MRLSNVRPMTHHRNLIEKPQSTLIINAAAAFAAGNYVHAVSGQLLAACRLWDPAVIMHLRMPVDARHSSNRSIQLQVRPS
mmetsp:Transcript_34706/g.51823  ORF Transcript_34706/g.51823 Transcript_34706/m.51823 type:complete len:81 (+) Transcript_34706:150-392(+)